MDALDKELIDSFLEEAPDLQARLEAALVELTAAPPDAEDTLEVLALLDQRSVFLEFEPLELLAAALAELVRTIADGVVAASACEAELSEGVDALAAAVQRLRAYDTGPMDIDGTLGRLAAAARGAGAPGAAEDAAPMLTPEALVALTDAGGDDEPLPMDGLDDDMDEDEEVAAPEPIAAPEPPPAAVPASEAMSFELETVDVEEGHVSGDLADFLPDFLTEAGEIIDTLDEELVRLEEAGADTDLLNEIFRAAHTLKGTSGFLGFGQMADLTHKMENVLDLLRKEELTLTQGIMDVVLRGVDRIKVLLDDIRNDHIVRRELDDVRRELLTIVETGAAVPVPDGASAAAETAAPETAVESPTEPSTAPSRSAPPSPRQGREAEQIVRVDVERIDKIMNLAEELVLGRNRLLQLNTQLVDESGEEGLVHQLGEATGHVGMLTGELQEAVMTMRMIPASRVFSRFPRMVRDLARDLDKQIDLTIEDNDTEIDKSVADEIGDPLVHLIRNAVDHGVERPEVRRAAGKAPKGRVVLAASHEGNHIVIRITDDGAGMDPGRLKAKAIEKGVIDEADARRMGDEEAYNLIFAPGFSTATQVTDVSGRGVGMDVVKTNISRLNGTIQIASELGVGTDVLVRLPLTLAIIGGLQVAAGDEIYLLPLTSVIEAVKVEAAEIETVRGGKAVVSRGQVLPLIDLCDALQVTRSSPTQATRYVVITGLAELRVGLLVDRLLGQVDVVIKSLGDLVGDATGIAGATILGDGNVALILDVAALMNLHETPQRAASTPTTAALRA